jgi:hypothetical protein
MERFADDGSFPCLLRTGPTGSGSFAKADGLPLQWEGR